MSSDSMVFRLKDSVDDLASANEGMSKYSYDQIQTSSGTGTDGNFSNGQLRFKWEHSSNKWWFPSKSYLQMRFTLTKGTGAKLTDATVAPNMNICANVFQQAEFLIGGKTVSKIGEYLPQVDALKKRTTKSKAWLDGVGASTLLMQHEQPARNALVTAKTSYEVTWQPPLSIFDVDVLPGGMYELILTPESVANFQKFATEQIYGVAAVVPGGGADDLKFNVDKIFFYVCSADADRLDDKEYYIDLQSCKMSIGQGTIGAGNSTQQQFDVSPSTSALTVAFQDKRAGFDPQASRSKFRANARTANATDAFVPGELSLTRLFVQYAGQSQPVPDADPKFDEDTDHTVRRYTESIMNSGLYWSEGSAESLTDFHERGSYYHFNFPKDPTDKSTRVSVYSTFGTPSAGNLANTNLLLFEHYKQVARIVLSQGRVVDVRLEDA